MTYAERLKILKEKKIQDTMDKIRQNGAMDADDYGSLALPDDFHFEPVSNHESGAFFGLDGWSENFRRLMDIHPIYVDPLEILCGRWRAQLSSYNLKWPHDRFPYTELEAYQERYGIVHGIGSDTHFAPDFKLGLFRSAFREYWQKSGNFGQKTRKEPRSMMPKKPSTQPSPAGSGGTFRKSSA